jgi:hypothetical protein
MEGEPDPAKLDKEAMPTDQLERFKDFWTFRIKTAQGLIVEAHRQISSIDKIIFDRTGQFPDFPNKKSNP